MPREEAVHLATHNLCTPRGESALLCLLALVPANLLGTLLHAFLALAELFPVPALLDANVVAR